MDMQMPKQAVLRRVRQRAKLRHPDRLKPTQLHPFRLKHKRRQPQPLRLPQRQHVPAMGGGHYARNAAPGPPTRRRRRIPKPPAAPKLGPFLQPAKLFAVPPLLRVPPLKG